MTSHQFVSRQMMQTIVDDIHFEIFDFFKTLKKGKKKVVVAINPGMRNNEGKQGLGFIKARTCRLKSLRELQVSVADVTELTRSADGVLERKYWGDNPDDNIHANALWGELMAEACLEQAGTYRAGHE